MNACSIVCRCFVVCLCQFGSSGLTNPPDPNIDYAFAFSPHLGGLLMHGGWCQPDWFRRGETWLLRETGWEPGPAGPQMIHHSAALDAHRNVMVVCGRTNYPNFSKNPTYEFDGTAWVQKPTLIAGNDGDVELAYDRARRIVVAFVSDGSSSETWNFDATNWTKHSTTTTPTPALWGDGALLTFDAQHGTTVLVVPEPQPSKADELASVTWTYDGNDWTYRAGGPPTNAFLGGMAYDAARSNVVLLTTDSET